MVDVLIEKIHDAFTRNMIDFYEQDARLLLCRMQKQPLPG